MIIRCCNACEFHEERKNSEGPISYCIKENCWAKFSKCIAKKALQQYLQENSTAIRSAEARAS